MTKHDSHITEYTGKASILGILQLVTGSSSLMSRWRNCFLQFWSQNFPEGGRAWIIVNKSFGKVELCTTLSAHTPKPEESQGGP